MHTTLRLFLSAIMVCVFATGSLAQPPDAAGTDTAVAEADTAAGKLKFNFSKQKWSDVLDWLAAQSDLALIMNEEPPGTFHYSDSKEYTPGEALDLINGVLLTKGFALIRHERALNVVDLRNGIPQEIVPRVAIADIPQRGRFEIVTVAFPIGGRDPQAILAEIKPLLGTHHVATALPASKQIVVTDRAGVMEAIAAVISSVPAPAAAPTPPAPEKPVLKTYPLDTLDPAATLEVFKVLLGIEAIHDSQLEVLNVYATPTQQAAAAQLLEQLQQGDTVSRLQLEVYPLASLSPEQRTQLVQDLELVAPKARVRIDEDAQQLVVWGSPEQHADVRQAIVKLITSPGRGTRKQIRVFAVERRDVTSLIELLRTLVPRAELTADPAARRIVAVAASEDLTTLAELITELDTGQSADDLPTLRVYPLEKEPPASLAALLAELAPEAVVEINAPRREVVVKANPRQQQLIAEAIRDVSQQLPPRAERQFRLFPLDPVQRDRFASMQPVIKARFPEATVEWNQTTGELYVWSTATAFTEIERLLEELKQQPNTDDEPRVEAYPVGRADVEAVVSLLQQVSPGATIVGDRGRQRVLVRGTAQDHEAVRAALQPVAESAQDGSDDSGDDSTFRYRVFSTAPLDPRFVLEVLSERFAAVDFKIDAARNVIIAIAEDKLQRQIADLLEEMRKSAEGTDEDRVAIHRVPGIDPRWQSSLQRLLGMDLSIDATTSTLFAYGDEAQHAELERVLEQLRELDAAADGPFVAYDLQEASPAELLPLVQQIAPDAVVIPSEAGHALLIRTTAKLHESLRAAIDAWLAEQQNELDEQRMELVAYPLKHIRASEVYSSARRMVRNASVAASEDDASLLVRGTPEDQRLMRELLEGIDVASNRLEGRDVKVFPLQSADPQMMVVLLERLFADGNDRVQIQADPERRAIVAVGSREDLESIGRHIAEADRDVTSGPAAPQLQAYTVREANAQAVTTALQQVFAADRRVRLTLDPTSQTVLAVAPPELHQNIAGMIETIANAIRREDESGELAVYTIPQVDPQALMTVLQSLYASDPEVRFTIDAKNKAIVVVASPEQQTQIARHVAAANEAAQQQNSILKIYTVRDAEPSAVLTALQTIFTADRQVTFTLDPTTRSIVAAAPAPIHELIAAQIAAANEGTTAASTVAQLRVYPLRHADVGTLSNAIRFRYANDRSVMISGDPAASALLAVAPPGKQEEIQAEVEAADRIAGTQSGDREVHVYPLQGLDIAGIRGALEDIVRDPSGSATLSWDNKGNRLVAVATPLQHARIRDVIGELEPQETSVRVFALELLDADAAEEAIGGLFDTSSGPRPLVTADISGSRLLVRGTTEQIDEIRQTLIEMGETRLDRLPHGRTGTRYVPFDTDPAEAIREIERIWNKLRPNPLRIDDGSTPPPDAASGEDLHDDLEVFPDAVDPSDDTPECQQSGSTSTQPPVVASPGDTATAGDPPPIVLIPDEGGVTIVSDDPEAVAQMERLLSQFTSGGRGAAGRSYSIFFLEHASASQLADNLNKLFQRAPLQLVSGPIAIMADERLNALIVLGRRNDRSELQSLLRILDQEQTADLLAQTKPAIVPLEYADVGRFADQIRNLYKTQLSAGGGRSPIEIPPEADATVAELLRQFNAASRAPLMTIDTDVPSNSLLLVAPQSLVEEIRLFAGEVDQAAQSPREGVRVLQLEALSGESVESMLLELLRDRNR